MKTSTRLGRDQRRKKTNAAINHGTDLVKVGRGSATAAPSIRTTTNIWSKHNRSTWNRAHRERIERTYDGCAECGYGDVGRSESESDEGSSSATGAMTSSSGSGAETTK
eukprot:CAMPEP_0183737386 /NCGR_PEP_ID=MMETSP0737-20130205/51811_1 /TAXON_ID=385413 /ORGANISM="Thalassiosira miniscula, Strain CCMP1093" /LENGTH=108 /DNA_ID=CAMNT_0025971649 /DNA_START=328 /DNA_END=654 /DNA_ORIENTATION=+